MAVRGIIPAQGFGDGVEQRIGMFGNHLPIVATAILQPLYTSPLFTRIFTKRH